MVRAMVKGPGGAMDWCGRQAGHRAVGAQRPGWQPESPARCNLPITGKGVVNMIITDLCVFEWCLTSAWR